MSKQNKNEATVTAVAESKASNFFYKYRTLIITLVCVVFIGAIGYWCWYRFVDQPKLIEAQNQTAYAEKVLNDAVDSTDYSIALYGSGDVIGFDNIIKEYEDKMSPIVYFHAGECALKLKDYNAAMGYFKKYSSNDPIYSARALACIGDCYVELGNYTEAMNYFIKAADKADNLLAAEYLFKAGIAAEKAEQPEKALEYYTRLKDDYQVGMPLYNVDQHIGRLYIK